MNKRLSLIYDMLPKNGRGIIDVGTDHGQLPIRLALSAYSGNLYASDIAEGPLNAARNAAQINDLENRIHFLLCDGLDLCPPEQIDCILIAGMGGDTICGILDRAEWIFEGFYDLVLQPMTRPEVVRYWLIHNGFQIDNEAAIMDDGHLYQMFHAKPGKSKSMLDAEYLIGSVSAPRMGASFSIIAEHQLRTIEKKLAGFQKAGNINCPEYSFFHRIEQELKEMKTTFGA